MKTYLLYLRNSEAVGAVISVEERGLSRIIIRSCGNREEEREECEQTKGRNAEFSKPRWY